MVFTLPLFLGFFAAALGITPPGLINMTAAKVSIKDGRNEAISFAIGATVIVFFQTFLALLFAEFINSRPDVINILQEIGAVIFIALTVYFLWSAKKPKREKEELKMRSKTNRFFLGMLLSVLNLFPIPYYVFISITLSSYGYFSFNKLFLFTFVSGAVIGSFLVFYLYILFFKKKEGKPSFLMTNGNYIIGAITGVVALLTLFKIFKSYWA
ncbi:LysE family transporter [Flavobacterium sp. GT3R68]|uniref:LysE family transporter n=1 Tax=Flavobacterium sp. GT3R68 TaxID=2594437 RepID=UPI000F86F3DA|nr:LysE family transporter [Flavobacterium sp. GT3R68]RTY91355.1 lysine transporter LysE [Flavobacterium sp. GSN2]TRW93981.1 lysine transporter LysE [Flavobacterium sp. GT3R68]